MALAFATLWVPTAVQGAPAPVCGSTGSDVDFDGISDHLDNCSLVANPDQRDTDGDGFGNRCDADLNNDGVVNGLDLVQFRQRFLTTDPHADFNGDGTVNGLDLVIFRQLFLTEPGPKSCDAAPVANFNFVLSSGAGANTVSFNASTSSDDGAIVQYAWDFGDGTAGAGVTTTRTYAANQPTYTVRLTVTDDRGSTSTTTRAVTLPPGLASRPSNSTCTMPPRSSTPVGASLQRVFTNLPSWVFSKPRALVKAPGDTSHYYVVNHNGFIVRFNPTTAATQMFLDLSSVIKEDYETGLLDFAFHPDWNNGKPYIYVFYQRPPSASGFFAQSRLSRFTIVNGVTDRNSEQVWISFNKRIPYHAGGRLDFHPTEKLLYLSTGDDAYEDDDGNGQSTRSWQAKMLRIDVDTPDPVRGKPYSIPSNNPFASSASCTNGAGCPEIYAMGLRNPWRWSFDAVTGNLWLGDVGYNTWEEVNVITRGGNYGWSCKEGRNNYNWGDYASCPGPYIDPLVVHHHGDNFDAVIGGYVVNGHYIYGSFNGQIWSVPAQTSGTPTPQRLIASTGMYLAGFSLGHNGELFVIPHSPSGQVHQVHLTGGTTRTLPAQLSQTGCFEASNPTQPRAGVLPYDLNSPLWSDRAGKRRWMALPNGTNVSAASDGDWNFPIGTLLIKEFDLDGKRVETRFMGRDTDANGGWFGYTYKWNDAQTDASLVAASGETRTVNLPGGGSQQWSYPSVAQCLECHTDVAGRALGPEHGQLNKGYHYPPTANQLTTLASIGVLSGGVPNPAPTLPDPADTSNTLEQRAKSYLHSNCSYCHRPGGPGGITDLRYTTPLSAMGVCNVDPARGSLGISGAKLFKPGAASQSILLRRMQSTDAAVRMPRIGVTLVDQASVDLITQWINSTMSCP